MSWKTAVNYRYVFMDIVPHRSWRHEWRFWKVQLVDLSRVFARAIGSGSKDDWNGVIGKAAGIVAAWRLKPNASQTLLRG